MAITYDLLEKFALFFTPFANQSLAKLRINKRRILPCNFRRKKVLFEVFLELQIESPGDFKKSSIWGANRSVFYPIWPALNISIQYNGFHSLNICF